MSKVCIESISYIEAPEIITSTQIDDMLSGALERFGIPKGMLEGLSGVKTRRWFEEGTSISDIATAAAIQAIEKANINTYEIGCVVNCSVSVDFREPTVSVCVQDKLSLPDTCINFDIANACMGFTTAVQVVSNMLQLNQIKYGLIVDAECSRNVVNKTIERLNNTESTVNDYQLSFATLTLGSGATAMILCREEDSKSKHIIDDNVVLSDPRWNMLCYGWQDKMICDAYNMLREGTPLLKRMKDECISRGMTNKPSDIFIPHQISIAHHKVMLKHTEVPEDKVILTFPYLGNIGPASWPITLAIATTEKDLTGKKIAVFSMGSGFNIGVMTINW